MTTVESTPPPIDTPDQPGPAPRAHRRWGRVALPVVAVGGISATSFIVLNGGSDQPSDWDERVDDLVSFVQDERGLAFDHPVRIDFLDEAEWTAETDIDDEEILDEDAQLLEHGAGMFRAVGLAEGELDLLASSEQLGTSGTVGMYIFDEERIAVRGAELTPRVRATLVHELTHVLQDQHYDVGDRLQALSDDDGPDPEGSLRVLVEGDADRVEQAWRDALDEGERAELDAEEQSDGDAATEVLDALPSSLVTFFGSDYILGAGFVGVLAADDGQRGINTAFERPPGPDEHVLNPAAYLLRDERESVDTPPVGGTAIEDLDGEFGAVSLYLTLAERIDPGVALAAVDGWGADAWSAFTEADRTCVALRVRGEDAATTRRLSEALTAWAAAMPAEANATVTGDGAQVDVVTCDAGVEADLVVDGGRSQQVIALPAVRSELMRQVLDGRGTIGQAQCFSGGLLARLPADLLMAPELTPEQQALVEQASAEQIQSCR